MVVHVISGAIVKAGKMVASKIARDYKTDDSSVTVECLPRFPESLMYLSSFCMLPLAHKTFVQPHECPSVVFIFQQIRTIQEKAKYP